MLIIEHHHQKPRQKTATVSVSMPFDKRHTLIYPRFNFPGHSTQWHWAYSSGMYAFFLKAPITYFKQSPTFRSCRSQVANLDLEFPLTKPWSPQKNLGPKWVQARTVHSDFYSNMVVYLRALANQEIIFPLSYRLPPLTLLTRGDAYRTTLIRLVLTLPLYFPTFQIKKCTIQKYKKSL